MSCECRSTLVLGDARGRWNGERRERRENTVQTKAERRDRPCRGAKVERRDNIDVDKHRATESKVDEEDL